MDYFDFLWIFPFALLRHIFSHCFPGLKETPTIADWLSKVVAVEGGQVGVDPNVMSSGEIQS